MKPISLTAQNKIYLEDPNVGDATFNITCQVIDEVGSYVKDKESVDIKERDAIFDSDAKKYYAEFNIDPASKGKYYRLTFDIRDKDGNFFNSDFYLVDLIVERQNSTVQLVPVPYFRTYILESGLDPGLQQKIADYPMDAIQELLSAAMSELENEAKLVFTKRTIQDERHNWYSEGLRETWWLTQTLQSPIISVEAFELWFANKKIFELTPDTIGTSLLVKKVEGTVQFLPPIGQQFAAVYYNNLESTLMSLLSIMPGSSYVPDVFRLAYTYGLDFMNLDPSEQAEIRTNIARRTMLNSIYIINKDLMKGSESQSADGVSYSFSNNAKAWYDGEAQAQKEWVFNLMRKYNKLVDIDFG